MNLAFQALAIFALALPGIVLKRTYRSGFFLGPFREASAIAEEVAYSLVLACALHAGYGLFVDRFIWPIDLEAAAILLLGQYGPNSRLLEPAIGALTVHPSRVFLYFASLYALSAALGYGAHWFIRGLRLDRKYRVFRFDHYWHYLLQGEIGSFPESNIRVEDFDFICIACVVDVAGGPFLYVGILDKFFFDKAGELDLLVLTGAMRRKIEPGEDDTTAKSSYYFIDAEYLYLKYSEVRNVSIRYISIPESAELPPSTGSAEAVRATAR